MKIQRFPSVPGGDAGLQSNDSAVGIDAAILSAAMSVSDSGVGVDVSHLNTGILAVGGDASLRGQKPFTLQTPCATVSTPTIAALHAARDAAGPGCIVRINVSITGNAIHNKLNQEWEQIPGTTFTGSIDGQADGIKFRGGNVAGGFHMPRSPHANNGLIENVKISGGSFAGNGIAWEGGFSGWMVRNVEITNPGDGFLRMWYDQAADPDWTGFTIRDSIMIRNAGWGTRASHGFGAQGPSMWGGQDGGGVNKFFDCLVYNNTWDNGSVSQGGFGLEVWNHETSPTTGKGFIVAYNDIRGGQDHLISAVRSRDNWIHHNDFHLKDGAYSCYEAAGTTHDRGVFEDNRITSTAPVAGVGIYHNNGAEDFVIQYNQFIGTAWILDGCCNGGAYLIQENLMTGGASGVVSGGSFPRANTLINNGAGGAGPRP